MRPHRVGHEGVHPPAVTSYQVSAAYRSEHDGHTLARRFLHRANTVCSRPAPSAPTRCTGRAQNPHPLTFNHQPSNPGDAARATYQRIHSARPRNMPTNSGSRASSSAPPTVSLRRIAEIREASDHDPRANSTGRVTRRDVLCGNENHPSRSAPTRSWPSRCDDPCCRPGFPAHPCRPWYRVQPLSAQPSGLAGGHTPRRRMLGRHHQPVAARIRRPSSGVMVRT